MIDDRMACILNPTYKPDSFRAAYIGDNSFIPVGASGVVYGTNAANGAIIGETQARAGSKLFITLRAFKDLRNDIELTQGNNLRYCGVLFRAIGYNVDHAALECELV